MLGQLEDNRLNTATRPFCTKPIPSNVLTQINKKLAHQRREFDKQLLDVKIMAARRLSSEVNENIRAGRTGRAYISVPLDIYSEMADAVCSLTEEWPMKVWNAIEGILNKARITSDAATLNRIIDQYTWSKGEEPFTIAWVSKEKWYDAAERQTRQFRYPAKEMPEAFSSQMNLTGSAAIAGIKNTARAARNEVSIAMEEYLLEHSFDLKSTNSEISTIPQYIINQQPAPPPVSPQPEYPSPNLSPRRQYLVPPKKKDDWYYVIEDMVQEFHKKYGHHPNKAEAWDRLRNSPPKGYDISPSNHFGEPAILMDGNTLGKRAFDNRWGRYNKSEITQ